MSVDKKQMDNYQVQISELEALQSIFLEELLVLDQGILADINDVLSGSLLVYPNPLEYTVTITSSSKGNVEIYITLPLDYPTAKPEIYVRGSSLSRAAQAEFNEQLSDVIKGQEKDEPCIYAIISWVQEKIEKHLNIPQQQEKRNLKLEPKNPVLFCRYWIYSHHIYSKIKRREIIELAKDNNITGFCLPGKPGIICIEGVSEECEDWWQKIKAMNWQKIVVKLKEEEPAKIDNLDGHRKFTTFQEISFPSSDRHNDMGELFKYFVKHDVQYIFKEYFGLEGKPASQ